ncbi:hypothetical protein GCM10027184_54670 [Saccharothrix stipae]
MKNATGIRCTCPYTATRRSWINPSPIRADCHLSTSPNPASTTAIPAITTANQTTTDTPRPPTMASTTRPASTGVLTASTADTTVSSRNTTNFARCGPANPNTRRNVPRRTPVGTSDARIALRIKPQEPSTTDSNAPTTPNVPAHPNHPPPTRPRGRTKTRQPPRPSLTGRT